MTEFEPDTDLVSRLPLPSHVVVFADGQWRRGWLIGPEHEESGWTGLVQYEGDDGNELTERLPGHRIALPEPEGPTERARYRARRAAARRRTGSRSQEEELGEGPRGFHRGPSCVT